MLWQYRISVFQKINTGTDTGINEWNLTGKSQALGLGVSQDFALACMEEIHEFMKYL